MGFGDASIALAQLGLDPFSGEPVFPFFAPFLQVNLAMRTAVLTVFAEFNFPLAFTAHAPPPADDVQRNMIFFLPDHT